MHAEFPSSRCRGKLVLPLHERQCTDTHYSYFSSLGNNGVTEFMGSVVRQWQQSGNNCQGFSQTFVATQVLIFPQVFCRAVVRCIMANLQLSLVLILKLVRDWALY